MKRPVDVYKKAALQLLIMPFFIGAVLFITAGTLAYWQGWVFLLVFCLCVVVITVYLAIKDPKLLERRMNAGPLAEKDPTQKRIMAFATIAIVVFMIFPPLDYRLGWSHVPAPIVWFGDFLVILGFWFVLLVFKENTYTAATIQIAKEQKVISTGPYALVRHPMYAGSLVMLAGVPLALGSWWGLFIGLFVLVGIIWRLLEEEKYLAKHLKGYPEYQKKVRYRLVPYIW